MSRAPAGAPPTVQAPVTQSPAGWYPDPAGAGELRYWDGRTWTPAVARQGRVFDQPLPYHPQPQYQYQPQHQYQPHYPPQPYHPQPQYPYGTHWQAGPSAPARPRAPGAGWYRDPVRDADLRYWDGAMWTPRVVQHGQVFERPMHPEAVRRLLAEREDQRAHWPARAVFIGLAGALLGIVLAGVASYLTDEVWETGELTSLLVADAALWFGLVITCAGVSWRYGTGDLARDFMLRFQGMDVARGLGASVAARVLGAVILVPIVVLLQLPVEGNLDEVEEVSTGAAGVLVMLLVLLVGAPLIEELFFRGLLQRALEARLAAPAAIAIQAGLFGLAHLSVQSGAANVVVFVLTGVAGGVFGAAAWHYHRLGPSILGHSFFNLVPALVIAFS